MGGDHLDLRWIPLGAGTRVVRTSGLVYEAIVAAIERRHRAAIYHTALVGVAGGDRIVVEMAPVPDGEGHARRGVVAEGPVGSRLLGRWRVFRYEVRCWPGGEIPDLRFAVGEPVRVADGPATVAGVLAELASVPRLVWGRDEWHLGDMWNCNSVIAWALTRAGVEAAAGAPPPGGRAPGWRAGVLAARRSLGTRRT